MITRKIIKVDSTYTSTFISGNSSWWNTNAQAIIIKPAQLGSASWYNGNKLVTFNINDCGSFPYPLRDTDGTLLYYPSPTSVGPNYDFQAQDIRSPSYRTTWISRAKTAIDNGATGIVIEGVSVDPSEAIVKSGGNSASGDFDWYESSIIDFLEQIEQELRAYSPGFILAYDFNWKSKSPLRWEDSYVRKQLESSDLIILNGIPTDPSLNNLASQNPIVDTRGYSLRSLMTFVDFVHGCGANVAYFGDNSIAFGETQSSKLDYNFATYMITFANGDYISINGESTSGPINTRFSTDYGMPIELRKDQNLDINNAGYIYRTFENGYVRLTPPQSGNSITSSSSVFSISSGIDDVELLPFPSTSMIDDFQITSPAALDSSIWETPYGPTSSVVTKTAVSGHGITETTIANSYAVTRISYLRDQEAWATNYSIGYASKFDLLARVSVAAGSITGYCVTYDGTVLQLKKIIAGTATNIGASYSIANPYTVGIRLNGNKISVYHSPNIYTAPTLIIQQTDSSIPSGGKIGFKMVDASSHFEDFGGGSIVKVADKYVTTPNNYSLDIESLGTGSALDYVVGSGFSKKGIESIIQFNGLRLNDPSKYDKYQITKIDGLYDGDIRDNRVNKPNQDGEIPQISKYSGRTITIEGIIYAQTREKLLDMETALQMAFYPLQESNLIFRTGDIRRDYYISCKKTQPIAMSESQEKDSHTRSFQITLRASDPYFYSINTKESLSNLIVSNVPTINDTFTVDPLSTPEYFEAEGTPYPSTDASRPKYVRELSKSPYFSVSSGSMKERKRNAMFGMYVKQGLSPINFTQCVKTSFTKFPVPPSGSGMQPYSYPIVKFVYDAAPLSSGEPVPRKVSFGNFNIDITTAGVMTIKPTDCYINKTSIPSSYDVFPYESSIINSNTNGKIVSTTLSNTYPFNSQNLAQKYGTGETYSYFFPTSPIIESIGSAYQLLANTDYWFVFSSTRQKMMMPSAPANTYYRINTHRIYTSDPFSGLSPSPVYSLVQRVEDPNNQIGSCGLATANDMSAVAYGDPNVSADEDLAIGAIAGYESTTSIYSSMSNWYNSFTEPTLYTPSIVSPKRSPIQILWGDNSSWGSSVKTPFSYKDPTGTSSSDQYYTSSDVTTYDDYKVFDYDYNSPDTYPTLAQSVINSGSKKSSPIISISTDASKPIANTKVLVVKNITNGNTMTFNTSTPGMFIPAGDQLIINCKNKTIKTKIGGVDYSNYLSFDSSWIQLEQGQNTIQVSGYGLTKISSSVISQDVYL